MHARFEIGSIVFSPSVRESLIFNNEFVKFYHSCLERYLSCDWGDLNDFEKLSNNKAVRFGGEIFAVYEFPEGLDIGMFLMNKVLWIVTDETREYTTVTFAADAEADMIDDWNDCYEQ